MSEPLKISACIITLDEEENLSDCLASVKWADEIVVVDCGSKDRTLEIAREAGCRVVEHEWLGHVKQKDLAVRSASHDWVFCLDGDERLADGGEEEIRAALTEDDGRSVYGYFFPRHTNYLGEWINHGGWWPEYRLRLFHRDKGGWTGMDPHDRVEVEGATRRLKTEMVHFNYKNISHHMEKLNAYTSIMAEGRFEKGVRSSLAKITLHPIGRFFRMYLLRRGFLDGRRGLILAVIAAFYVFLKYAKLWELERLEKN